MPVAGGKSEVPRSITGGAHDQGMAVEVVFVAMGPDKLTALVAFRTDRVTRAKLHKYAWNAIAGHIHHAPGKWRASLHDLDDFLIEPCHNVAPIEDIIYILGMFQYKGQPVKIRRHIRERPSAQLVRDRFT